MPTELGVHHQRLAGIVALQQRKAGWGSGRFAIEGPTLLDEACEARMPIVEVYATPAVAGTPRLTALEQAGTPVFVVEERAMRRISDLETPPGLLAVVDHLAESLETLMAGEGAILGLSVGDPGNAGTLVRSARAFGVERIVFGRGGVDPYHPKVVRAAMGALFTARIGLAAGDELVAAARAAGRPVVAADLDGEPLEGYRFPARPVLAVGHERQGVRAWLPERDAAVRIPQRAGESLNAGVAGSIFLYAWMSAQRGS
jgi:TrmH family RNA methyltransferase